MGVNSSDFTNEQSPQGLAFSEDMLGPKVPAIPAGVGEPAIPTGVGGGAWLQMTSALLNDFGR